MLDEEAVARLNTAFDELNTSLRTVINETVRAGAEPVTASYWKANIVALIAGTVDPYDLVVWDEEGECFYFPDDWHQYSSTDLDRIYCEWLEAHPPKLTEQNL